jgi:MoxR-like ATPase
MMSTLDAIKVLKERMNQAVIGQEHIVDRLVMGLLANGNLLVEGLPGLAKTRSVRAMAEIIDSKFSRIQFTPDMEPMDITGRESRHRIDGENKTYLERGPIFGNIILADEINRAPSRVQSALLEAMEERQVTIAGKTYELPPLFIVMATQNPIEQEGTYPLPEAQKDRFLMHLQVHYVDMESELAMMRLVRGEREHGQIGHYLDDVKISQQVVFDARAQIADVVMNETVSRYVVELVYATRFPLRYSKELEMKIDIGISPRGTLALDQCARVHAWMQGRNEVTVEDVQAVIHDVFRHRLIRSQHAITNEITNDAIVDIILKQVPAPKKHPKEI